MPRFFTIVGVSLALLSGCGGLEDTAQSEAPEARAVSAVTTGTTTENRAGCDSTCRALC
jgi:hypothetical protein